MRFLVSLMLLSLTAGGCSLSEENPTGAASIMETATVPETVDGAFSVDDLNAALRTAEEYLEDRPDGTYALRFPQDSNVPTALAHHLQASVEKYNQFIGPYSVPFLDQATKTAANVDFRWWGGHIWLNREEAQWLADALDIGGVAAGEYDLQLGWGMGARSSLALFVLSVNADAISSGLTRALARTDRGRPATGVLLTFTWSAFYLIQSYYF